MAMIGGLCFGVTPETAIQRAERISRALKVYAPDGQVFHGLQDAAFFRLGFMITPEDDVSKTEIAHRNIVSLWDGRLDNRDEILSACGLKSEPAASLSDSDIVAAALERFGPSVCGRLKGDFALAAYFCADRTLILVRDPMGTRPLHWSRRGETIAFSSMPQGLFAIDPTLREVDRDRLASYLLYMTDSSERTFFKGVRRVLPSMMVTFTPDKVLTERVFPCLSPTPGLPTKREDLREAFDEVMTKAVRRRMRSRRVVSAELSAGLDSSTICWFAANRPSGAGKGIRLYTAAPSMCGADLLVPAGRFADESDVARSTAKHLPDVDHSVIKVSTRLLKHLKLETELMGRPILNICNREWMRQIYASVVSDGGRVLLVGGLGNLTVSYTGGSYLAQLLNERRVLTFLRHVRAIRRAAPRTSLRSLVWYGVGPFVKRWPGVRLLANDRPARETLREISPINPAYLDSPEVRDLIAEGRLDYSGLPWIDSRRGRLEQITGHDSSYHFAEANALGVELADPYRDPDVVQFCLGVSESVFWDNGRSRGLVRRLMKGRLPNEVLWSQVRGLQASDWYLAMQKEEAGILAALEAFRSVPGSEMLDLDYARSALRMVGDAAPGKTEVVNALRVKTLRTLTAGAFLEYAARGAVGPLPYCNRSLMV